MNKIQQHSRCNVERFSDENILQTLSAKLNWSRFVELIGVKNKLQK